MCGKCVKIAFEKNEKWVRFREKEGEREREQFLMPKFSHDAYLLSHFFSLQLILYLISCCFENNGIIFQNTSNDTQTLFESSLKRIEYRQSKNILIKIWMKNCKMIAY